MVESTQQEILPGFARSEFGDITFELPIKYQPIKLIGKGTYGAVISVQNTETGQQSAIKKLSHIEDVVSHLSKFRTQQVEMMTNSFSIYDIGRCQKNSARDHHNEKPGP